MFKIFSVDDHIVEPPDVWTTRVPAKFRDRAPHMIEEDGRQVWEYEDGRCLNMALGAVAGKPREEWNEEPTRFSDMIPGCYDPKARAQDLLSQGVFASVSFPTLPRYAGMLFNSFKDKELASHCVRAWNDFVLEEWCPAGPPGLFVPMIICQVWNPPEAVAEIERCLSLGAKAVAFPENGVHEGLPSFHGEAGEYWDPIWTICEEAALPLCMHIGSSGFMPAADPNCFAGVIVSAEVAGMLTVGNLCLSRAPREFPGLKFVISESGIGWVPALLQRADRQAERHSGWAGTYDVKPSEIFARNIWVCTVEEPLGLSFYPHIGEDKILAETDYPHADTTYPSVQKAFEAVFAAARLPETVIEKITHGNAERLFDWTMADESLYLSPDVTSWRWTLESDPFAALKQRHDVDGVRIGDAVAGNGTICQVWVTRQAHQEPCGADIGPDGLCAAGHQA